MSIDPSHIDTAFWLALVAQFLIPGLSALATRRPSALTGFITVALTSASGFVAEWAASPHDYDWRHGSLSAAIGLLFAWGAKTRIYSGDLEQLLHSKLNGDGVYDVSTLPEPVPVSSEPAVGGLPVDPVTDDAAELEHVGRHEAPEAAQ